MLYLILVSSCVKKLTDKHKPAASESDMKGNSMRFPKEISDDEGRLL